MRKIRILYFFIFLSFSFLWVRSDSRAAKLLRRSTPREWDLVWTGEMMEEAGRSGREAASLSSVVEEEAGVEASVVVVVSRLSWWGVEEAVGGCEDAGEAGGGEAGGCGEGGGGDAAVVG